MKTTTTTTTKNTTPTIAWKQVMRSNERVLIYDLRNALKDNDTATALTLIKSWIAMQDKDNKPTDPDTVNMYDNLMMVFFTGKNATVKGTKEAELDCMSQGRLKAWLYTFHRGNVAIVDKYAGKERPEEKQGKVKQGKSVKVPVAELEAFRAWKAAQEKNAM